MSEREIEIGAGKRQKIVVRRKNGPARTHREREREED